MRESALLDAPPTEPSGEEATLVALAGPTHPRGGPLAGSILTLGFGTTVAMWALAYVCRLPGIQAPSAFLAAGFLVCLYLGGYATGRLLGGQRRWLTGARVGALSSLLNLLILGSFLADNKAQALYWTPGFLLVGALLGACGASVARPPAAPRERDWLGLFARVAAGATLILIAAGGLVTGHEAGLAVPDWPNSFTSNMFLYPLSRMTGGIYYEHAHRLFGSLVGLTTLVLSLQIALREPRLGVKLLGGFAFVLVVAQGILGGLRVTGRLTLSAEAADLSPSLSLAAVHGITGQLFFVLLVALGAILSPTWRRAPWHATRADLSGLRRVASALVGLLLAQLALGALLRHFHIPAIYHVTLAVVLALVGLWVGAWAWLESRSALERPLGLCGAALAGLIGVQFVLGWIALAAIHVPDPAIQAPLTTLHQTTGALVLASAFLTRLWIGRLAGDPAGPLAAP